MTPTVSGPVSFLRVETAKPRPPQQANSSVNQRNSQPRVACQEQRAVGGQGGASQPARLRQRGRWVPFLRLPCCFTSSSFSTPARPVSLNVFLKAKAVKREDGAIWVEPDPRAWKTNSRQTSSVTCMQNKLFLFLYHTEVTVLAYCMYALQD